MLAEDGRDRVQGVRRRLPQPPQPFVFTHSPLLPSTSLHRIKTVRRLLEFHKKLFPISDFWVPECNSNTFRLNAL
jgi:hypothetical protein